MKRPNHKSSMHHVYTFDQEVVWVDLHQPNAEDLTQVMDRFSLPPDIVDELSTEGTRSGTELRRDLIYMVLYFPVFQHTHRDNKTRQELNIVLTQNAVITAHYDTIDALHKFQKMCETESILHKGATIASPHTLFFALLKKMYKSVYHEIEYIESWIDQVEEQIFNNNERNMVFALSQISRRLLDMKKTFHLHDDHLYALREAGGYMFEDGQFTTEVDSILQEYRRLEESIQVMNVLVDDLRDTNDSLLSTKQNEIMNRLTMIAVIAIPPTFVATMFSIGAQSTPLIGSHPYDFWLIAGMMAILSLITYIWFKVRGWL